MNGSVRAKSWITKHNTISMIRQLFDGRKLKQEHRELVLRSDKEGNWTFGQIEKIGEEEKITPVRMSINDFIELMSNENILYENVR
jgi:hypothetical protein